MDQNLARFAVAATFPEANCAISDRESPGDGIACDVEFGLTLIGRTDTEARHQPGGREVIESFLRARITVG
jgi:hypothetical protein